MGCKSARDYGAVVYMHLINLETNEIVIEFNESGTVFHSSLLEKEMERMGIAIPHGMRGSYHGKDLIHLGDPDFERAFKEVYYLTYLSSKPFAWQ